MKLIKCDRCKEVVEKGFVVEEEQISPHNGNTWWTKKDFCEDCLRKADILRVIWR